MFVMRTKTNLKNPTCFDRFADHHQGLVPVPCTITTCQFFLLLRIIVMWRSVFYMCVLAQCLLVWCLDEYTSRHHTNKHGASTHIQVSHISSRIIVNIPYYHVSKTIMWMLYIAENIPPHNWNAKKQEKLTSSNCTRHGN